MNTCIYSTYTHIYYIFWQLLVILRYVSIILGIADKPLRSKDSPWWSGWEATRLCPRHLPQRSRSAPQRRSERPGAAELGWSRPAACDSQARRPAGSHCKLRRAAGAVVPCSTFSQVVGNRSGTAPPWCAFCPDTGFRTAVSAGEGTGKAPERPAAKEVNIF